MPPQVSQIGEYPTVPDDDFKWTDDDSVIIRGYGDLAVYFNPRGDIVLRQQNMMDDDSIVVFAREHADTVIEAIKRAVAEAIEEQPRSK
jgi:hypothetical protein